ncbi:Putative ubiquitin carboxyl-terminal hydrolase 50, partial [Eurypyga helias]
EAATAFGRLVSDMWHGESDCVSPEDFQTALGKRYPAFSQGTQQDAQEFLICVLNELHEALQTVRARGGCCFFSPPAQSSKPTDAKASGGVSETSIITELFEGELCYDITCLKCKTTVARPERFTVLSLPIPAKRTCSLQDCLKRFFQQDTLTRNNQIHCSRCGAKRNAAVEAIMTKAPPILVFHLKRFEWQGKHNRKLSTNVCYPLSDLDLAPYGSHGACKDAEYSLCAVVNHSGLLDDGHYTALCKHSLTRNWYHFDDAQVTQIPTSSVQTDTAYLLFY